MRNRKHVAQFLAPNAKGQGLSRIQTQGKTILGTGLLPTAATRWAKPRVRERPVAPRLDLAECGRGAPSRKSRFAATRPRRHGRNDDHRLVRVAAVRW